MTSHLQQLIGLQEIDKVIDDLNAGLQKIPAKIEERRGEIKRLLSRADEEKAKITAFQLKKKEKEIEAQSQEDTARKNEMQLNTLKSNEAYRAMMNEIEASKKKKAEIEDEILAVMEEMEQSAKNAKQFEAEAKGEQQKIEAQIKELEAEMGKLGDAVKVEQGKRDAYLPNVSKELLSRYEFLRKNKKGGAVMAPIKGEVCGACNTLLPSSTINEIKKAKDMITCETCSRILYFPEAPQAPAPAA